MPFNFPTGPAFAATHVPSLTELITNDHAHIIPPTPIIPVDPCAPVIDQLFHVTFTPPPTDFLL